MSSDTSDWEPQDLLNDLEVKPNDHFYRSTLLKGLSCLPKQKVKNDKNELNTTRNSSHIEIVTKVKKKVFKKNTIEKSSMSEYSN